MDGTVKIAILEISGSSDCCECDNECIDYNITDWDEVSFEDCLKLEEWAYLKNRSPVKRTKDSKYYIVKRYEESIPKTIEEYKQYIEKEKEEEEKRKKIAEKRKKTLKKNKEEKEKERLKKLKEKYGELYIH